MGELNKHSTLVAFSLSVAAEQIQSTNTAFANAGIQGCIAVADNADGEPFIIHDCNTEDLANQDWNLTFWTTTVGEESSGKNVGPQQLKVFGDKCIDVNDGINADGTKLQIWTCAEGNTNQQWISVTDNTFQWSGTNKCIDLTDGKITDGKVLQIYTCDSNNSNQKWSVDPNPDSSRCVLARLTTMRNLLCHHRAVHLTGGDCKRFSV
ncbi:ricin B lectin domain-containing protein [Mycena capillaripes]|nr:ricin B lectin domain-containing protein [Mycena capillaripes]